MIKQLTKKQNFKVILLIISVIATVAGCIAIIFGLKENRDIKDNANEYEFLIEKKEDTEGTEAKLCFTDGPYAIDKKYKYFVVYDSENLGYVVKMSEAEARRIGNQVDSNGNYTLYGKLHNIPLSVQNQIIKVFNSSTSKSGVKLDYSNYEDYFGNSYLDVAAYNRLFTIGVWATIVAGTIMVILLISVITYKLTTITSINSVGKERLEGELQVGHWFEKEQVVLTSNFFVFNTNKGLMAVPYNSLGWIYGAGTRGTTIKHNLNIFLKNGKMYKSAVVKAKGSYSFEHLLEDLINRAPNVLVGYNFENLTAYKEMKRTAHSFR